MDIPISQPKKRRLKLFQEFQWFDIIPYSISLFMIIGDIYLVRIYVQLSHTALQ